MSYASLAKTAVKLLTKFGGAVTFRANGSATYAMDGQVTTASADSKRLGLLLDIGNGLQFIRGQSVLATDKRMLMDSTGAKPTPADMIQANGDWYSVVSAGEINPAGTPVIFDLHLRK